MIAICRKELADYFTSVRFVILFLLACLASAGALYAAYAGIRSADIPTDFLFLGLFITPGEAIPSIFTFVNLMALFFIPIIGISLGFDAINKERSNGTLSRIMSQPIYRDNVINGKFLAGIFILFVIMMATLLIVSGLGLRLIGVPPTSEEIVRLFLYLIFTIIYGAFWMGLSILFSTLFRSVAISLIATIGIWLFFSFFYILMIAPAIADAIAPIANGAVEARIHNMELLLALSRVSPSYLFSEATSVLLNPPLLGSLGVITLEQVVFMIPTPLSLGQSMILIWPQLTGLIALTGICFAVSYVIFMRQEIRST